MRAGVGNLDVVGPRRRRRRPRSPPGPRQSGDGVVAEGDRASRGARLDEASRTPESGAVGVRRRRRAMRVTSCAPTAIDARRLRVMPIAARAGAEAESRQLLPPPRTLATRAGARSRAPQPAVARRGRRPAAGARREPGASSAMRPACRAGWRAGVARGRRGQSEPASTAAIRGVAASGMNLSWVASRLRATRRALSAPGALEALRQDALPTCQTTASGTYSKLQPAIRARTFRSTSS